MTRQTTSGATCRASGSVVRRPGSSGRHLPGRLGLLGLIAAVALLLAACGSTTAQSTPEASVVRGGTATYALQATDSFSWMLPFESSANEEPWELATDEGMWRPLYFEGQGDKPVINYGLSFAYPPVYSDHDTTVTIRLKHEMWSDGVPVTTSDVRFGLELYEAGEDQIATFVPGELPQNVASIDYVSPTELVLHLDRSYSQQWFTDNQLVDLIPLPRQVWDKTCGSCAVGHDASTPAGAKKVFTFLYDQSKQLATYATNRLWQVVDGPWHLTGYDPTTGRTTLSVNRAYTGAEKPHLDKVILETFTSDTAEVGALRDGAIDYGWIPFTDLGLRHYFETHGFTVAPWAPDYFEEAELGYTGAYAKFVRQLYIRQALQHLVDEPLYLKTTLDGLGQLTYGPAPNIPGDVWASAEEKTDPDPYSLGAARALLASHGWRKGSKGYLVCERPGPRASECGSGIARGTELALLMNYSTGSASTQGQAGAFQTAARGVGIDLELAPESAETMYSIDGVCPSSPPCDFAIALYPLWFTNYGDMSIYPTAGFAVGKGVFFGGGYDSPTYEHLLGLAQTHSGVQYVHATENYLSRNLAALWFPTGDNQISVVKDTLRGWRPQQVFGDWRASRWYFVS